MGNNEQIIELRKFSSNIEAEIAQGILRGAGIECEINDHAVEIYPLDVFRSNSIRLLVFKKDEKIANDLLAADFDKESMNSIQ